MDIGRYLPAERLVQKVIFWRGGEILAAADDVGYAHKVVVHDVCKVICGHPVGLYQYLVVDLAVVHLDVAVDHVVKGRNALAGHLLADNIRLARGKPPLYLLCGQVAAAAVVVAHLALGALLGMQSLQPLGRAEAVVGAAVRHQLLGILAEHPHALALHIWADRAADVRPLVPDKAGLPAGVIYHVHRAINVTLLVGVLNAQDEGALVVLCRQVGVEGGAQVAHMHIPCGRGCKTGADELVSHTDRTPFICYTFCNIAIWNIAVICAGKMRGKRLP